MIEIADPAVIDERVAAFGLPGREPDREMSIEKDEWPSVISSFCGRRLTGLAVASVDAGWLLLSTEQNEDLLNRHREAMLGPLAVERGLLQLSGAFEDAGVEFVVLKGPALAHTVYPDPSWRFFGDLDLLVRTRDWRRACAVLEGLGFPRELPEPRRGFDERFGKACVYRSPGRLEVDLHRTLVVGPFGLWIETDVLFECTTEFGLGDRTFRRLDDTSLLLHACMHASLGAWPPLTVPVRDVAQVAHFAQVDWETASERSARWRLGCVVRDAFQYASRTLGMPIPPEARAMMAGSNTRKERRALQAYTDRRARGGTALATLRAIPGIRAKAAYIRALLLPDRAFLAARGAAGASYFTRWRVALRWMRRRTKRRRSP